MKLIVVLHFIVLALLYCFLFVVFVFMLICVKFNFINTRPMAIHSVS